MQAIIAGDYKFEPGLSYNSFRETFSRLTYALSLEEYWENVSDTAKDFVTYCLTVDPRTRPTAHDCLQHKWLASELPHFVPDPESPSGLPKDLLPTIRKGFNAKKTCAPLSHLLVVPQADIKNF